MAQIRHELKVQAARSDVLRALTDRMALERWNRATVSGGPQEWTLAYPDGPTFRWKVIAATQDGVTWRCTDGPGDAKGTEVTFEISPADKGRTQIQVVHRGWGEADENFAKCNTLWAVLLGRLALEAEGFEIKKR
jgi:uncharacterized protein YndB with AHSA1/START domain